MASIIAILYPDPSTAQQAMELVDWAILDNQIVVMDACWMSSHEGEVKVYPDSKRPLLRAELGGAAGLLLGAVFAVPVAGFAAGAAFGYYRARQKAQTFRDPFVESVRSQVAAGGSAIVVLYEEGPGAERVGADLLQFGGTVQSSTIPTDQLMEIQRELDRQDAST